MWKKLLRVNPGARAEGPRRIAATCGAAATLLATAVPASAGFLDDIGLTQLQSAHPTLNGSGVSVSQVEAPATSDGNDFAVNPANPNVNYSASRMTWVSGPGTGTVTGGSLPNSAGSESGHADTVAFIYYGTTEGVAQGVSHVYNYNANYFYDTLVAGQTSTPGKVVNQSFTFGTQDATADQNYDDYAARYHTIFVSAVGGAGFNGNRPTSPGTPYNTISVNVYTGSAATAPVLGPTTDGRSKPDISAPAPPPGGDTSYVTPEVAGAAAILVQAAGANASASDERTVKALLLNGAVKPAGFTRTAAAPLDPAFGAGELNVNNSYNEFAAGQHGFSSSNTTQGPTGATGTAVSSPAGWDFNTITSTVPSSRVNHYLFTPSGASSYNLTATLDWDRNLNQTNINNLSLYLYNTSSGTPVDLSTSLVDNVQDLYDLNLPPGTYDLEVVKAGGALNPAANGDVSFAETYALAYNFTANTPEPSSSLLAGLAGAGLLTRRRRRRATRADGRRLCG